MVDTVSRKNNDYIKTFTEENSVPLSLFEDSKFFKFITDIVIDEEKTKNGKKKRQTEIKLNSPVKDDGEWLYLITINNRIVKIGGTRKGLRARFGSYLCGYHIEKNRKSGKASETNKYVYNTLCSYLKKGYKVKYYGYKLPTEKETRNIFGEETEIHPQYFHAYESKLLDKFKKKYNYLPFLNQNSDPEYR